MELSNQQTSEEQTDVLGILLSIVSHRLLIIVSLLISILIGIIYINYKPDVFKTAATLLITKDQADPSSFLLNNENEFLYNKYIEREDHASVFKSTLILNKVVDKLGLNYRCFKNNKWKANELLTKESLPFEFYFKNDKTVNKCIVSYKKERVYIEINDKIFSFSSNESEFENSLFSYKTKSLNDMDQNSYVINQFNKKQTINAIKKNYIVSAPKNSNTYGISYAGPNKVLNSAILEGIAGEIIENDISEKKNVYQVSINFIDSRIYTLKGRIDSLNAVISNYKILNGLYIPETQTNSELINLNEIDQKIFNNSLQSELSFKLINDVEKQNSFEFLPTDIGIENENINEMVFQFNKIILEKNTLLVEATEKNPLVIQSQNQLIDLRANILNSLNIYIDKLKMKLNRYKGYKQKSNALVGLIPLRESELSNLEKELLLVSNLHSYLSQKKEEALINLSSLESNIKLINEVDYILESKTNKSLTLTYFLLAGFIFPVGFSLLIYFYRMIYVDIEYLKQKLSGINFLGIIKFSKENIPMEKRSIQYELLKRIYHNINMLIPKSEKGTSIMITSCIKNEGKTFTAFNLSTFLASKGKKVVLIGSDLGNPDLSKLFDQKNKNSKGLTNIINDTKNDFQELFEDYKITNNQFDTLFVGTQTNTKISVFDTKKFDDLISYLKEKYDYIIFDSAPILFMVDSLELLEKSDYVVHVFRKNFSSKKLVNYVLDYKEKYNKKNIGYVITDDTKPDKFIDKYGYGYGYGYGYNGGS
jgi:Mrp family chromosome partitioning ATPase/uncharacterized protein involved in exopolysaccharide biosynthesis